MAPEAVRLAKEFPKRCGCGLTHTKETWDFLSLLGTRKDEFATSELRNCPCGSTLMAATQIHDLSAE